MLKAVALYRDGSKLSQPLNASQRPGGRRPTDRATQVLADTAQQATSRVLVRLP